MLVKDGNIFESFLNIYALNQIIPAKSIIYYQADSLDLKFFLQYHDKKIIT